MSRAIILQQAEPFGPGRIVPLLRDFGIGTDVRRLYAGDEVPADLETIRLLIVLGGPLSVNNADDLARPWIGAQIELLKRLVALDRITTLGINFGAQLLAHAAGAKVSINGKPGATPSDPITPMPEFGWGPVTFPFPGGTEPLMGGLMDGAPMFHWHAETFDLPKLPAPAHAPPPPAPPPPTGNALLCSSRACRNQAFRFKNRLFGFQFHFELSADQIEGLAGSNVAGQTIESSAILEGVTKNFTRYARLGDRLLTNLVQFAKAY